MMWIPNFLLEALTKMTIKTLQCGPIPQHVAIILDGNRRFGVKTGITTAEAHRHGQETLTRILLLLSQLGVKETTVYAMSIGNLQRSHGEIEDLTDLFTEVFTSWKHDEAKLERDQLSYRFFGNLHCLPDKLQTAVSELEIRTRVYKTYTVNVALVYGARDEMFQRAAAVIGGLRNNEIDINAINEEFFSNHLLSNLFSNPDLIIRTSGETRFSDFLLWQVANSHISFPKVLWPKFSFWHLVSVILGYQKDFIYLAKPQIIKSDG